MPAGLPTRFRGVGCVIWGLGRSIRLRTYSFDGSPIHVVHEKGRLAHLAHKELLRAQRINCWGVGVGFGVTYFCPVSYCCPAR